MQASYSPLRGLGTFGAGVQRHMWSLVLSGERELEVPGVSKVRSSIRGRLASSVLMDTARFLVIGPRGELGARSRRAGTACRVSLGLAAMADELGVSGTLEKGRFLREDEVSTSVIIERAQHKRAVSTQDRREPDGGLCARGGSWVSCM